ncbi:hypothetical protein FCH28_28740 [Streptomyces piniterrae]|uniref:Toxin-antitoxin system HicB family antitoxin n=1 Tax=Streptomyces piniterrae TaxID=2571125 RepID=A0A4U0MW86_9ACTN|nr:hypothetical protein [Streptomyces piniterrae]TJZ45330.1 hypothetical protein FCH28_28740 [Streptomyces piniterrae]
MSPRTPEGPGAEGGRAPARKPQQRKQVLLRLDPLIHDALSRWANDELRSANAQIEFLLRKALSEAGRLPRGAGAIPRRGRPPKERPEPPPEPPGDD